MSLTDVWSMSCRSTEITNATNVICVLNWIQIVEDGKFHVNVALVTANTMVRMEYYSSRLRLMEFLLVGGTL